MEVNKSDSDNFVNFFLNSAQGQMEPNEVEFLSEKELISIVPNFSQDKVYLIGVGICRLKPV